MTQPVFRASSTVSAFAVAGCTGAEPTGTASGDIVVASLHLEPVGTTGAITPPAGWTQIGTEATLTDSRVRMYWIRRGGSAPSYAWTWATAGTYSEVNIESYSLGIGSGNAIDSFTIGTPATTGTIVTPPPVTILSVDTLVTIWAFNWNFGWTTVPTAPTGYTTRIGNGTGFDAISATKGTSATGTETPGSFSASAGSSPNVGITVVIASQAAGGGAPTPLSPISAPSAPQPVSAPTPRMLAGFGQTAQPPRIVGSPTVRDAALPSSAPALYQGVVPAAVVAVARVLSTQPQAPVALPERPQIFAGSAADPGVISTGGATGSFLPDDPQQPAGPARYAGIVPAIVPVAAVIAAHRSAPAVALPPSPRLNVGAGQAAQAPMILTDPWFATATFDPIPFPRPQLVVGFGQPAQTAFVASAAGARAAFPSASPALFSGFGQAAQPPVIASIMAAPAPAALPPVASLFSGVAPAAQLSVATILGSLSAPIAPLPPQATIRIGFGQAAQAAVVFAVATPPLAAALPPAGQLIAGVVPPATTSGTVLRPLLVVPQELPPAPASRAGFGQAAQVAQVITAPFAAPSVDLFVTGRLVAGFGQAPALPVPVIGAPPQSSPAATPPPRPALFAGFGQAAQVAAIYSAAHTPDLVALPPTSYLAPGFAPAAPTTATILRSLTVDAALLPPQPATVRGFGSAAQPPVILAPTLLPPRAELPPQSAAFVGVPIGPPAVVTRALIVRDALVPPPPSLAAGFGVPSQNAAVITVPFVATGITLLPPGVALFAGFGSLAPYQSADRLHTVNVVLDLTDRMRTRRIKL